MSFVGLYRVFDGCLLYKFGVLEWLPVGVEEIEDVYRAGIGLCVRPRVFPLSLLLFSV
jgi:hypothetical protein